LINLQRVPLFVLCAYLFTVLLPCNCYNSIYILIQKINILVMPQYGLRSNLFLKQNRQFIHLGQCIQKFSKGGTLSCSSVRPTLSTSWCLKSCYNALYLLVVIGFAITLILSSKWKNTEGPFLFRKTFFRPENVQSILCCFYLVKIHFFYML
jgi:hypothetical protein